MTQEFYTILTEAGEKKELDCLSGKGSFDLWYIAVGDSNGSFYEPEKTQTSLKNECWRELVSNRGEEKDSKGNITKFAVMHIPADAAEKAGKFTIREIGGFDKEGNLLILGKVPENVIGLTQTGNISQNSYRLDLSVINELALPFLIDPSINTATIEYCDKHYQKTVEKGEPNGYAPLDKEGFVPIEHVHGSFVPFCVNSGPMTDGAEVLLSLESNLLGSDIITAHAPFTLTSTEGVTKTVTQNLTLDVSGLADGNYTILYNFDTNALEAFGKTVHTGKKFPDNAVTGDMLFDISVAPYKTLIKTETAPLIVRCSRIGRYAGGAVSTFPYNQNGQNSSSGGSLPLFSAIAFDHVLTGQDSIGWALQGSLVTKVYPDAVAKIVELYTNGTDSSYRGVECKRSQDGRYIADISQKSAIDELFASTGIADFYILDPVNEQFYLPKSRWFNQYTVDTSLVNNFNEAGLPNIEGSSGYFFKTINQTPAAITGAYKAAAESKNTHSAAGNTDYAVRTDFDASKSNPIYGSSDTVQPPSSSKLVYMKVGNTIVNESLIDVGKVLSELQLKANTNADNFTPGGKAVISGLSMPSNRCVDLTLGASGATYIAPANGYFSIAKATNANNQGVVLAIRNEDDTKTIYATVSWVPSAENSALAVLSVSKGQQVKCEYTAGGAVEWFRFIYAQGEEA